ncbi:TonB C-terminal domain-containing protein [bacterium]|nr:TonB C-terminal domain-containing protein [bacterium]
MARRQETLIYIEKENITEAEFMSRSFVSPEIKNKAYINALGAELVMKYLASEGVSVSNVHNIHSISKILEKIDISDILLENIHIDVRVIFDENQIFIPKSHFDLEIAPDIYVILKLDENFKHVECLGYVEAFKVKKEASNDDYYFVNKNKLSSAESLAGFVRRYPGKSKRELSEEDILRGRELSVSLADHNISADEQKELLELLLLSDSLRESVLEFDNFETLAYSAAPNSTPKDIEPAEIMPVEEILEPVNEENLISEENIIENGDEVLSEENLVEPEEVLDLPDIEPIAEEINEEVVEENLTEDVISEQEEDTLEELQIEEVQIDNELTTEENILPEESINLDDIAPDTQNLEAETIDDIEDAIDITTMNKELSVDETPAIDTEMVDLGDDMLGGDIEDVSLPLEDNIESLQEEITDNNDSDTTSVIPENITLDTEPKEEVLPSFDMNLSVDSILDQTISAIDDEPKEENPLKDGLAKTVSDAVHSALEKTETGIAAAGTIAAAGAAAMSAAEAAAMIDAGAAVSEGAMKLASVAGEAINDIINENIDLQNKNLDKIDYQKTDIAPDVQEIPQESLEEISNLANLKNNEEIAEESLEHYEAPLDLSDLNKVETFQEQEEFVQETVDMSMMETVDPEQLEQNATEVIDMDNLSVLDNFAEIHTEEENLTELPDSMDFSNDYTIDENNEITGFGDVDFDNMGDENLVDFNSQIEIPNNDNELQIENSGNNEFFTDNTFEEAQVQDFSQETVSDEITDNEFADLADFTETNEITDEFQTNNETIAAEDNLSDITDEFSVENEFTNMPEAEIEQEVVQESFDNQENTEQDWLQNDNYDDLQDIETPQPTEEILEDISDEELITEPQEAVQDPALIKENSRIISDKTFNAGEIPIDINYPDSQRFDGPEALEEIYDQNSKVPGGALLQNPGRLGSSQGQNKSIVGIGLGIAGMLISLALVGAIGFGVAKMFKAPKEEAPQPITDDAVPTSSENGVTDANTLDLDQNNVVSMDNTTDALSSTVQTSPAARTTTPAAAQSSSNKTVAPTSFIEVKKLTWEVPDYISYNPNFKQYFQSVGKSLKLSLTSDLLLATDYAYSNEVKVSVTFEKDGTFKISRIVKSSGSNQIDKIVLQTVNQTLNALKAPHSVGNDESTTAILKIYF